VEAKAVKGPLPLPGLPAPAFDPLSPPRLFV